MAGTTREVELANLKLERMSRSRQRVITSDLGAHQAKTYSQFGEDGVIDRIAQDLGISEGTFFEFGIGPADGVSYHLPLEGNFVLLRERGWQGTFLDGTPHIPPNVKVHREMVSALNINHLYEKYKIPEDLDFMSIDVDGQEFWIWMALQARPKVMVIEYNGGLAKDASITTQFNVNHAWDGTIYHGASLLALTRLAQSKSYTLVFSNGVNAFFIRDDLVSNKQDFEYDRLYNPFTPHAPDPKARPWVTV